MFLKVNRGRRVKGLTCADGWKQRKKAVTGDATFPTASTESILTTSTIDAHEWYNVGIYKILGFFLSSDIDEDMKMALLGMLAKLMVNIVPQIYRHHVIYEKRMSALYATLNKALYGWLRSAFLLHERIVADISGKGFEINPCNPCVANKIIGGKKITVSWRVDDLEVLHVDPKGVTNFIEWLEGISGELRITRGKVHEYFGMTLDFRTPVDLWLTVVDCLKGVM